MALKLRIMVVDDDPDLLALLSNALDGRYEIVTAVNGADALEKAVDCEPDIFIVDIMMPMMSGLEFVRRIRRDPLTKSSPVILLSAKDSREDIREGYAQGVDLYLTKPVEIERLLKNIQVFTERGGLAAKAKKLGIEAIHSLESKPAPNSSYTTPPLEAPTPPGFDEPPADFHVEAPEDAVDSDAAAEEQARLDPFAKAEDRIEGRAGRIHSGRDKHDGKRRKAPEPEAPEAPEAEAPQRQTLSESVARILVVDDDAEIRTLAREMLGEFYQILDAGDGLHGVQTANKYKPDIFVIDGMMPRMSGYQMCQFLRQSRDFAATPIIFMSTKSSPKERRYVDTLRVSRFLSKPFPPDDLFDAVESIAGDPGFRIRKDRLSWREVLEQEHESSEQHRKKGHRQSGGIGDSQRAIGGFLSRGAGPDGDVEI